MLLSVAGFVSSISNFAGSRHNWLETRSARAASTAPAGTRLRQCTHRYVLCSSRSVRSCACALTLRAVLRHLYARTRLQTLQHTMIRPVARHERTAVVRLGRPPKHSPCPSHIPNYISPQIFRPPSAVKVLAEDWFLHPFSASTFCTHRALTATDCFSTPRTHPTAAQPTYIPPPLQNNGHCLGPQPH